ncbi:MAG: hypothetical protein C4581_06610 [Nitrospiraceae bacterium]|nr:MAG: hypothetical protein C4581_06610 [Nitrospiraceae bacterium]
MKPVYVKGEDRYKGIFLIGETGTGKTNLLKNIFEQDVMYRFTNIHIDAFGNTARDVYSILKGNALYNSMDTPVSINPLTAPYNPYQHADNILEVFNQVVTSTTSTEQFTVKMCSFLSKSVISDLEKGRKNLMLIRNSMAKWKDKASQADKVTIDGILYRLDLLLTDKSMERMLCGNDPVDWGKLIETGESFIMDCHGMSETKMVFIGTLITHALKSYFRYTRKDAYRPCSVIIDECHNFINPNWLSLIKEGRKYCFAAVLATQDKANMEKRLFDTIMSNVGTILCFRVGSEEAMRVGREFTTLTPTDLMTLPKYHVAYRTPDGEGIAKTRLAFPVKEINVPTAGKCFSEKPTGWFSLKPYRATDNHIVPGTVVADT